VNRLSVPTICRMNAAGSLTRMANVPNEVDFGLEWTVEAELPPAQRGQDGQVLRLERVRPRQEHVRQLALVHEDGRLPLADHELGPVLDFVLVALEPVDHGVVADIQPFDDIHQLAAKFVPKAHLSPPRKQRAAGFNPRGRSLAAERCPAQAPAQEDTTWSSHSQ